MGIPGSRFLKLSPGIPEWKTGKNQETGMTLPKCNLTLFLPKSQIVTFYHCLTLMKTNHAKFCKQIQIYTTQESKHFDPFHSGMWRYSQKLKTM